MLKIVLVGIVAGFAHDGYAQVSLSDDALRRCSDAGVAECQYKFAEALERGANADLPRAKTLYESAYSSGYKPAGEAILRLVAKNPAQGGAPPERASSNQAASVSSTLEAQQLGVTALRQEPTFDCLRPREAGRCDIEVRAVVGGLDRNRLVIGLHIANRRPTQLYVSRGLARVFQDGVQLRVLQKNESTSWARLGGVVGHLLELAPSWGRSAKGLRLPKSAADLSKNAISTAKAGAAKAAVKRVPLPPGRLDYLTSGYIAPHADLSAVVMVEVRSTASPVRLEIELDGNKANVTVDPSLADGSNE